MCLLGYTSCLGSSVHHQVSFWTHTMICEFPYPATWTSITRQEVPSGRIWGCSYLVGNTNIAKDCTLSNLPDTGHFIPSRTESYNRTIVWLYYYIIFPLKIYHCGIIYNFYNLISYPCYSGQYTVPTKYYYKQ